MHRCVPGEVRLIKLNNIIKLIITGLVRRIRTAFFEQFFAIIPAFKLEMSKTKVFNQLGHKTVFRY